MPTLPPFEGIDDYVVTDPAAMPTEPVYVQKFRVFPKEVQKEMGPERWVSRVVHEYTPEPLKIIPIPFYRIGTKSEFFVNFMSWYNVEEKRWERIPPGFYPERFQFAFNHTEKIWELWLNGHLALRRLRGEEGDAPPDSAYMAVPDSIPELDDHPDVPASSLCRPPPPAPASVSTTGPLPPVSSRQKSPSVDPAPRRSSRTTRSVLPARYNDYQHVDAPPAGVAKDQGKRKRADSDGGGAKQISSKRARDNQQSGPIPWPGTPPDEDDDGYRPRLAPPPSTQPRLNLFPSDDEEDGDGDEDNDVDMDQEQNSDSHHDESDDDDDYDDDEEEDDDDAPPQGAVDKGKGRAVSPEDEEEEDGEMEPTPPPKVDKGKGRAVLDDDEEDDDEGHGDEGDGDERDDVEFTFSPAYLTAKGYSQEEINQLRALFDLIMSTSKALKRTPQALMRACGLTIAFSRRPNSFNTFEAWLKWQEDTPSGSKYLDTLSFMTRLMYLCPQ